MFIQTESKAQGWRAVAQFEDGLEALVFVGRSSSHVRDEYAAAFLELFDEEEREQVSGLHLQQWQGTPDAGKWQTKAALRTPTPVAAKLKLAA